MSPGKPDVKGSRTHTHTERSQTGFFCLGVACLSEAGDESEQLMAGLFAFNYNCYEWKLTQPVWLECALLKTKAKGFNCAVAAAVRAFHVKAVSDVVILVHFKQMTLNEIRRFKNPYRIRLADHLTFM